MRKFKVYLHGEFVGHAESYTKGGAVTQFANKHYSQNEFGLMAVSES